MTFLSTPIDAIDAAISRIVYKYIVHGLTLSASDKLTVSDRAVKKSRLLLVFVEGLITVIVVAVLLGVVIVLVV